MRRRTAGSTQVSAHHEVPPQMNCQLSGMSEFSSEQEALDMLRRLQREHFEVKLNSKNPRAIHVILKDDGKIPDTLREAVEDRPQNRRVFVSVVFKEMAGTEKADGSVNFEVLEENYGRYGPVDPLYVNPNPRFNSELPDGNVKTIRQGRLGRPYIVLERNWNGARAVTEVIGLMESEWTFKLVMDEVLRVSKKGASRFGYYSRLIA